MLAVYIGRPLSKGGSLDLNTTFIIYTVHFV